VELQLARWRRAIDALTETYERDANRLQILQKRHEMAQIASEPIEPPADDHIQLPALSISDERIQGRSSVFAAADALIDVFLGGPSSGLGVAPEFQ
jgi:hypothetical protein